MVNKFDIIFDGYIPPNIKKTENIMISCPFHEDKTPSFCISTNENKPVVHCFSCDYNASWIGFYMKTRGVDYRTALKDLGEYNENYKRPLVNLPKPVKAKPPVEIIDYGEEILYASQGFYDERYWVFFGRKLFELQGITLDTAVACMIGYIKGKGWIFPAFRYPDGKCVGYEIREKEFKKFPSGSKCYKADNTPSCMCAVWFGCGYEKCYVMEGFKDAYYMYQYLHERNQKKYPNDILAQQVSETILTPSNGVSSIHGLLEDEKLLKKLDEFKQVIFVLDADKAGKKEMEKLMLMNEKWKFFGGLQDGEDFGEWYLRKEKE